jgi:flavin reductase (DIM6/NTAB) family NADH-FMN oxidoreductase RutF
VTDKIQNTGFTVASAEHGGIYFSEARIMLECRKLYVDNFKSENFLIKNLIHEIYPKNDFHYFFIGEIITCLADTVLKEKMINMEDLND